MTRRNSNDSPREVKRGNVVAYIIAFIFLIFAVFAMKIWENVDNEKIVVNQVPITGEMVYWTTPGLKFQKFGQLTEYNKTQQLWFSDQEGEGGEKATDLAIPVIFNDAGNGKISGSLRVKLPTSETHLARIQTDYHGMDRLMNDLVRPTVVKVVYASGPLMSSFESYAEKKNDLIYYITDQLNNGVYKTAVREAIIEDALTGEEKRVKIASLVVDSLAPGGYARQENSPFAYYGLEIGQLSISKIDYDSRILDQIKTQQEANMAKMYGPSNSNIC